MSLNQENTLFLIIDIQEKLLRATFNNDVLEKNSKTLAKAAQILNLPVIITEQYPQGLGASIDGINGIAETFVKTSFNALLEVDIFEKLKSFKNYNIVVFGIETHICVYQTVKALLELGFSVTVVSNACGSRSEFEYSLALDNMNTEGAKIKSTEMVLFEILKSSKHPNFKEIQALIK